MAGLTKTIDTTTVPGSTIIKWVCTDPTVTGTDTWVTPEGVINVKYLVVGGGGSGTVGSGGGAGGYRISTSFPVSGSLSVQVGAGGSAGNGGDSIFSTITATGGGCGASYGGSPGDGGSGGGGAPNVHYSGGTGNTPSTTPSQGNNGGSGGSFSPPYNTGGGGGAGSSGSQTPGSGGIGVQNSITGLSVYYAGGGGGGTYLSGTPGSGGLGGGGDGGVYDGGGGATNGTNNFGGGGGGGGITTGGSGVVIISYIILATCKTSTTNDLEGSSFIQGYNMGSVYSLISLGSGIVIAGTGDTGCILRSSDSGETWIRQTDRITWVAREYHASVALLDGSIVLSGGVDINDDPMNDVWRSTDKGANWTQQTASAGWTARHLHTTVVNSTDGSIVLMGGFAGGRRNDVWRSTNQGTLWNEMKPNDGNGWTRRIGHTSVVNPTDSSIVLMGGDDGSVKNDVWRSTDNGATWTQQTASAGWTARRYHTSVALSDGSILLMGGNNESNNLNDAWISDDNGATWTQQTASAGWTARVHSTSVILSDDSIVLMGGIGSTGRKNDVWRSTDNGATWTQQTASAGWTARSDHTSVVLPDDSIVMMGGNDGSYKNDVWRSTDNGATWVSRGQQFGIQSTTALCDLGSGNVVAGATVGSDVHIYKSTDEGETWIDVQIFTNATTACFTNVGSGTSFFGTDPESVGTVYKTTNYGTTWVDIGLTFGTSVKSIYYMGSNVLFVGDGDGDLWRSVNNGISFTNLGRYGGQITNLSMISPGSGILLVGTGDSGKILRLTNTDKPAIYNTTIYAFDSSMALTSSWVDTNFPSTPADMNVYGIAQITGSSGALYLPVTLTGISSHVSIAEYGITSSGGDCAITHAVSGDWYNIGGVSSDSTIHIVFTLWDNSDYGLGIK